MGADQKQLQLATPLAHKDSRMVQPRCGSKLFEKDVLATAHLD
jgi:hypothetical protein